MSIHETAVQVSGLQPEAFYVVRVALVNSLDFSSKSLPIRFRTKPATSGDFFTAVADGHETDQDGTSESVPRIRPFRGLKDITPASPTSVAMERDTSSGGPRRTLTGRRSSPGVVGVVAKHDPPAEDCEPPEGSESVQQLTEKLDALRRENDEAERSMKEEEEEELRQKEELTRERDRLRAEAAEKEKASRNLKRDVNILERQNTAAQNERSKQERLLQAKKQERLKLKDDTIRWERESEEMMADVERIQQEKASHVEKVAKLKEELRAQQTEEAAKVRTLDDDIKEKTAEVKKLERALKNSSPNGAEPETHNLVEQMQKDAEEDRQWNARQLAMQQEYTNTCSRLEDCRRFLQEQHRYLESLRAAERRRQDEMTQYASPPPQERLPRRGDSQRSRHAPSRHSTSDSPRLGAFPPVSQGPFSSNGGPGPISGFPSAPFLDLRNGMTIPGPNSEMMSEEDREKLTGGAAMSPGVEKDLLPAGLFNAMDERKDTRQTQQVAPLPGLGQLPGLPGLPGPTPSFPPQQSAQDIINPGPTSPGSASSRSPSVFASPQASQHNLNLGSPENIIDADRRSIRSNRSTRATSGGGTGSRFSGMFGIKQRSKANNLSDDIAGPPLGKANSMPRQDPFVPGLDNAARKRNSSISGSMGLGEPSTDNSGEGNGSGVPLSRRAFGLFTKDKSGGWPSSFTGFGRRPASPRPDSTHSSELPRPSMDSSRWGADAWPSGDATAGARSSPLAFGPGWNMPGNSSGSRLYGSRHPSRRPSVQYGATGPPEDIMEDSDSGSEDGPAQRLAPIGTSRPAPGAGPSKKSGNETPAAAAPKLNPNAKDFKSFFSSMKLSSGKKDGAPSRSPGPDLRLSGEGEESPPHSRKSRDTRSMNTTESSLLDPASGRESVDLARVPSYSASSMQGELTPGASPSLAGSSKESFMQKITRKSSSSKFSLPTFARNKSRLNDGGGPTSSATSSPAQGYPAVKDEEEDDGGMSESVGSLSGLGLKSSTTNTEPRESRDGGSSRGSRSWSSVLKLGRKEKKAGGGNTTPSLSGSGMSIASETEDDEEGTEGEEDGGGGK